MNSAYCTVSLLALVGLVACGGRPLEPADETVAHATGHLSGLVYRADTGAPLGGAAVSAAGARVTTAADGSFRLMDLAAGTVLLRVTAAGFDPLREEVSIREGENRRDVHLEEQTVFESGEYALWLPRDVSRFRGVFFYLAGQGFDTRPIATRDFPPDIPPEIEDLAFVRLPDIATRYGLGVMGARLDTRDEATFDGVFEALDRFAAITGHAELAGAALLPVGYSWGGCFVSLLTAYRPERIIGFQVLRGSCAVPTDPTDAAGAAAHVPGQFIIGEADPIIGSRNEDVVRAFEWNRALGAPWALAIEPNTGHDITAGARNLWVEWLAPILERRLSTTVTGGLVDLVPIDEASGWLGHIQTAAIADYASYDGDPSKAAWFPSMSTALNWRNLVRRQLPPPMQASLPRIDSTGWMRSPDRAPSFAGSVVQLPRDPERVERDGRSHRERGEVEQSEDHRENDYPASPVAQQTESAKEVRDRHDQHDDTGKAANDRHDAGRLDVARQQTDSGKQSEGREADQQVDRPENDVQPAQHLHVVAQSLLLSRYVQEYEQMAHCLQGRMFERHEGGSGLLRSRSVRENRDQREGARHSQNRVTASRRASSNAA
jgi:hypothetical protein